MVVEVRTNPNVDRRSLFWDRGYFQRSARRANGDVVHITGDNRWEVEHCRRLLMRLARRANLRMIEIAEMAGLAEGPEGEEDHLSALATAEVVVEECDPIGEFERRLSVMRQDSSLLGEALSDAELVAVIARAADNFEWLIANDPNPDRAARAEADLLAWKERLIPLLDRLGRPKGRPVLRRRKVIA